MGATALTRGVERWSPQQVTHLPLVWDLLLSLHSHHVEGTNTIDCITRNIQAMWGERNCFETAAGGLELRFSRWTVLSMDSPLGGRSSRWTVISMDGPLDGRSSRWTILSMDSPLDGQSSRGTVLSIDSPLDGQSSR